MRYFLSITLSLAFLFSPLSYLSARESIDEIPENVDALYRQGEGEDGAYTSLATSMLGWGAFFALGIGLFFALVHNSEAPTTVTTTK